MVADDGSSTAPLAAAETTGRWVVTFAEGTGPKDHATLLHSAGLTNVASSLDFEGQVMNIQQTEGSDAASFAELGVAVVSSEPAAMSTMQAAADGAILAIEPEYVHHILEPSGNDDYIRGYRDGV